MTVLLLGLLAGACSAPIGYQSGARRHTAITAPPPTFNAVTAPLPLDAEQDLSRLENLPEIPGALLRRAWILQETDRPRESLPPLTLLLYGDLLGNEAATTAREIEALARWLRSRAFERLDQPDRAAEDHRLALAGTRDRALIAALQNRAESAVDIVDANWTVTRNPVRKRASWSAAVPRGGRNLAPLGLIERITVHHSATLARRGTAETTAAALRAMQRYHQRQRGWADIGYHFIIDPDGRVWEGRELRWQGAHAGNTDLNRHNVGICLLGNFLPSEQGRPATAQLAALRGLVLDLATLHDLPPDAVRGHGELKTTDCPGPYLKREVAELRVHLGSRP